MTYPQYFLLLLGQAVETSQMYFQRIFVTQPGFITQQAGGRGRAYLLLTSYFKFLCLKLSWEAFLNRHHQEKTIKCMKLCGASLLEVQQPRKLRKTAIFEFCPLRKLEQDKQCKLLMVLTHKETRQKAL